MSPELINPSKFGSKESRPTKESDCYALGMVIYEVLSGWIPFYPYEGLVVVQMVLDGERPERPQEDEGKLFTDGIWRTLELCWKPQPRDRISAESILLGLEGNLPHSSLRPRSDTDGRSTRTENGPPAPLQQGSGKGRWVGRLARSAQSTFNLLRCAG